MRGPFLSLDEVDVYLATDRIECLECGLFRFVQAVGSAKVNTRLAGVWYAQDCFGYWASVGSFSDPP